MSRIMQAMGAMAMRKRVTLRAFVSDVTGECGLGIASMPTGENALGDIDGSLTAHDLLEHVNGPRAIGTIADELEAMGAAWYIRGRHGMITRGPSYHAPQASIAADVSRMACDFMRGDESALVGVKLRTRECDADADIDDILSRARVDALAELRYDDADEAIDRDRLELYFTAALHRMRTGYRKAARKYRDVNVTRLFWTIADAIREHVKCYGREGLRAGMSVSLDYGTRDDGGTYAYCDEGNYA